MWLRGRGRSRSDYPRVRVALLRPGDTPGESAIFSIPIPEKFSALYAGLGREEHDESPPHITVLYLGPFDPARAEELEAIGAGEAAATASDLIEFAPGVEYFDTDEATIAHKAFTPETIAWLTKLHDHLREHCAAAGFEIKHHPGPYRAHSTLAYLPLDGDREMFEAEHPNVPEGSWLPDALELWGTSPETPKLRLG